MPLLRVGLSSGQITTGQSNFGDTDADLSLEYDGANISITPGQHQVILDLSVPGNYTYKIL